MQGNSLLFGFSLIMLASGLWPLLLQFFRNRRNRRNCMNENSGKRTEFTYYYNERTHRGFYTINGDLITVTTGFGTMSERVGGVPDVMLAQQLAIDLTFAHAASESPVVF